MRLIICRHGETIENQQNILQGYDIQGTLSARGREQAMLLAKRLEHEKIDVIYSSDLARAADTAHAIAKFHPHTPLILKKELRERKCGAFSNKKMPKDWRTNFQKYMSSPGVETNKLLYGRAKKFVEFLLKNHKNESVLVVGHNAIDRALICALLKKDRNEINTIERLGNTSISVFEITEKEVRTISFNSTGHLNQYRGLPSFSSMFFSRSFISSVWLLMADSWFSMNRSLSMTS